MSTDVIIWAAASVAAIAALTFAVIGGRRALLARRVRALDPVARAAYEAVLTARTAVKDADRAHKKAVSAKAFRVYGAAKALRKAEGIGRQHLTTVKSSNTISKSKVALYENELRVGTIVLPLAGVHMRLVHFGELTASSRPTIGRTIAGAAVGHAVGSAVSDRRGASAGAGLAGAIVGASMEKTTVHDGRSTTIHFEVDGQTKTVFTAWADDRAKIAGFMDAVTKAQRGLAALEASRGPAITAAKLELVAAEAETEPVTSAAIAAAARSELTRLTDMD